MNLHMTTENGERAKIDLKTVLVRGNQMLPLFSRGEKLAVSDEVAVRVGDPIIVCTAKKGMMGGKLVHNGSKKLTLSRGGIFKEKIQLLKDEVRFVGRVMHVSRQ